MKPDISELHQTILTTIVHSGFAPTIAALADSFGCSPKTVKNLLHELEDYHGVVLHKHNDEIWVAHPFSLAPTNFVIRGKTQEWWGNCAWCSLGIATLVGDEVQITTTVGANDKQVTIEVAGKEISRPDLLVHFPTPMSRIWDNVIYSCSMMLVFETEGQINRWCSIHNVAKGDIKRLDTLYPFAAEWYGRHLDPNWRKWTVSEARELMDRHGFSGPIWSLPNDKGRF
ncbi:MAG TPA: hypothetical protein EYM43_00045 [Alphaproteobacteria bacterium]|nr:hypothetical protein [Alphaproteobacteria bacterium]